MKTKRTRSLCLHVLLAVGLWPAANVVGAEEAPLPKDVPSLVKLLRDKDPKLRASAANELGHMRGKAAPAIPELVGLLGDEEIGEPQPPMPGEVWRDARVALIFIGRAAVAELIKALENPDAKIRERAASALGTMRSPPKEALPALLRLLHDKNRDVRCSAVWTMGRMKKDAERAIPSLIELYRSDLDEYVRRAAITEMVALDSDGTLAIPACIQGLQDKEPGVRGEAARGLGSYGPRAKAAVLALTESLGDEKGYYRAICADCADYCYVQCDAVEALGKIGPAAASALPKLRKMLDTDGGGVVQAAVACALLRIDPQDKEALPALLAMLKDSQRETYESDEAAGQAADDALCALTALENIGPSAAEAVPAVKKALQHRYANIRCAAIAALAAIARKEAVPLLIEQMNEEKRKSDVQRAADEYYIEEDSARGSIVEAFGKLGADAAAAVPLLTAILADDKDDFFIRPAVIESLGKMGVAAAASVPQLIKTIESDDNFFDQREKAAIALGRIGPAAKAAVPRLLKVLSSDPNEDIREAARTAVQKIAPEAVGIPKRF